MKQQAAGSPVEHWKLSDGTMLTLRPIGSQDAELEQAFVRGLSEESKYFRFMGQLRELSPEMLKHFVNPNLTREAALIITIPAGDGEEEIAVGRYAMNPGNETCEFAIEIGRASCRERV